MDADRAVATFRYRSTLEAPPNVNAGLGMVRTCEGTSDAFGYRALFGYRPGRGPLFNDLSCHPNLKTPFFQTDGSINYSTAAGAYQILIGTWRDFVAQRGAHDFSATSQDECALWLIERDHAMDDLVAGRLQAFIDKCSGTWASLPASTYPQPRRTYAYAADAFVNCGGVIA